jgi:hypothetical protein
VFVVTGCVWTCLQAKMAKLAAFVAKYEDLEEVDYDKVQARLRAQDLEVKALQVNHSQRDFRRAAIAVLKH